MALSGTEVLFVTGVQANGQPGATLEQTTTQAIANLSSGGGADQQISSVAITTAGNGTLTAAALTAGIVARSGPVAAFTDTTDTAALIVAAIPNAFIGQSFLTRIKNQSNFVETIAAGSGVTYSGTSTVIPPNSVSTYLMTLTSLTAVTMLHVGTTLLSNGAPTTSTTLSTVGAGTITGAGIAGGYTVRGGAQSGTPFTDTTDTADLIIAADLNAHVGDSWKWTYVNGTNAVATLAGGTGVTPSGITVIPAGQAIECLVTYTAASTVTIVAKQVGQAATSQQSLIMAGSTSGTTTVVATATAGSTTLTLPAATDTLVGKATTDTLTNKTLTAPVIGSAGATFTGSGSGTTAVAASATAAGTLTLPAVTGVLASTTGSNLFLPDLKRCSASVTANATQTYANVTGLSFTVVPGTYQFDILLPSTVASGTGGIKYAFNYTTTALTSIEATGVGFTASAVAVQHTTTTTTQTDLFTQAAVVIYTRLTGTMVVSTGGTVDVQMAQNTSNASNSIALVGSSGSFVRIA